MLHPGMWVHALLRGVQTVSLCIPSIHGVDDVEIYWERYWQVPLGEPCLASARPPKKKHQLETEIPWLNIQRGVPQILESGQGEYKENMPPAVLFC